MSASSLIPRLEMQFPFRSSMCILLIREIDMTNFSRNNLDAAESAYLRQHQDNPIHWQEWNSETLAYARESEKILFASVGYSTCHWCHVMAQEAFSDPDCAAYLNRWFVPVKVDREQRPDIDQFMMEFLVSSTGSGGWPLNVFLAPDLRPFFAMTYASHEPRGNLTGFLDILKQVKSYYFKYQDSLQPFQFSTQPPASPPFDVQQIDRFLEEHMDDEHGGFKQHQKFPPHTSLLYGITRSASGEGSTDAFVTAALDAVSRGGLQDHLQGGFFRYCTDAAWTIPHFEKMLYDQAMLLWVFSLAARRYASSLYRESALGIIRALDETFLDEGLYCAAHDADTDHREGASYIWTKKELEQLLSETSLEVLKRSFLIPEQGNFEGSIHLVRREAAPLPEDVRQVCERMLLHRKKRKQPLVDRKKLTEWNALTGIALLQAHRHLEVPGALERALSIRKHLMRDHVTESYEVIRGTFEGSAMSGRFLEDHASLLLFLTFCYEEDRGFRDQMVRLAEGLKRFKSNGSWFRSSEKDFLQVPAHRFDSPSPSPHALAEFAVSRTAMVTGGLYPVIPTGLPGAHDFRNYASLHTGGHVYVVTSPKPLEWNILPLNSVQAEGEAVQHCYACTCMEGLPGEART